MSLLWQQEVKINNIVRWNMKCAIVTKVVSKRIRKSGNQLGMSRQSVHISIKKHFWFKEYKKRQFPSLTDKSKLARVNRYWKILRWGAESQIIFPMKKSFCCNNCITRKTTVWMQQVWLKFRIKMCRAISKCIISYGLETLKLPFIEMGVKINQKH